MPPDNELLLGEIKGKVDLMLQNQAQFNTKLDSHNQRLNSVETKSTMSAAAISTVIAVGFELAKAKLGF